MRYTSLVFTAASAVAMLAAAPALAQEAPAGEAVSAEEEEGVIVVTARRVEERLQDVPIAVSAFSEGTLEGLEAQDIGDLQGLVPNLNIAQGRGSNSSANIFIRGVGQPDALSTFDPAVGVYIDDVFLSRIRGALVNVYDVERVEVLRGPQGTLFGKNTEAGVIRLVTKEPSLTDYSADAQVSVGSFDLREFSVNLRGPLIEDRLGAKLAVRYAEDEGFIFDPIANEDRNGSRSLSGRFSLKSQWSQNFTSRLDLDVQQENADLQLGRRAVPLFQTDLVTGPRFIPGVSTPQTTEFDFQTSASPTLPNRIDLLHWGAALTSAWDVNPNLTLKSIISYRELTFEDFIDIDATPLEFGDVFVGVDQSQYSSELQALFDFGRVRGVAGLYYLNELIRSDQASFNNDVLTTSGFGLVFPIGFEVFIDDRQELDSFAGFFQTDIDIIERLTLTLGLRATYEEKTFEIISRNTITTFPGLAPIVAPFSGSGTEDFFDLAPRVSLNYQLTDDVLVYASYAQGFKSGGFNGRADATAELEPFDEETVETVEVGVKSSWFGNRFVANLVGFYNDYQDFQASVPGVIEDDALGPVLANTVLNAGQLRQFGFEFEGVWRVTQNLQLNGTVGFLDAEYGEFLGEELDGDLVDFSARTPAFSPRWTARAAASYTLPTETFGDFTATVAGSYRGDTFLTIENSSLPLPQFAMDAPALFQPNYWLLDAFLNWTAPSGKFSLNGGVKNITNEVYAVDAQNFTPLAQTLYFAPPRNFVISANFKF